MGACADVRRKRGKEPKRKLSGFYQGVWNTISGLADARWFAAVRWPVVEFLHRSFGVRSTSTLPPARDEHARPARRRCGCPARGRRFGA